MTDAPSVVVENGVLAVVSASGHNRLPVSDVNGYLLEDAALLLLCGSGEHVRIVGTSEEIQNLAATVEGLVCSLGEVTRSMLTMGTKRGSPGADHDTYFAPLLETIGRARECDTTADIVSEFSGAGLVASMTGAVKELAGRYHPDASPERRALTEQLLEEVSAVAAAAAALDAEASNFTMNGTSERFMAWRRWHAALLHLAMEIDSAWIPVLALLTRMQRGRRVPPSPNHPA